MRVPMAVMMMARNTLLVLGNARIAVSFERRFTCPSLRRFPNIRHRQTIRFAQSASNGSSHPVIFWGDFLMRPKLAIFTLVVASLFGSTLVASAQTQAAPGASSQGTVSPGATSGKKTQHEKGVTTGSSTRSGAKSGTMTPSGQGNMGSGADYLAAPKSGGK
jgi:hypothetical protein